MILGVTNNPDGTVIQRLPVSIKVSIGVGPTGKTNYPQKLDHFLLQRKVQVGEKEFAWAPDSKLHGLYGDPPDKDPAWYVKDGNGKIREIGIILMDDDPENVFPTSLAWWTQAECRCRGELVQIQNGDHPQFEMRAIRRTKDHPEGEQWPGNYKYQSGEKKGKPAEPCGEGCPDLEAGRCKVSGDLRFILDKMPMFGAICRLHTTSYRSVRQVHASLQQIRKATGGRLAGIRAMLKVRPEKMAYTDEKGKHTTTVHILSLEISAEDMRRLLDNMTETAKLFQQTRKLLGGKVEIYEEEEIRASEIAREFYPEATDEEQAATEQPEKITESQWTDMWSIGRETFGHGPEKDKEIAGVIAEFGDWQKTKDVTVDKYPAIIERLKQGPKPKPEAPSTESAKPPKAEIPPAPEPQPEPEPAQKDEEFALTSEPVEAAAPAKTEAPKPEPPPPAKAERPKDVSERADAVAAALGIETKVFKAFVAEQCGVASITKAGKAKVTAVVTAVERFIADAGIEIAKTAVPLTPKTHEAAKRTLNSFLFEELRNVK